MRRSGIAALLAAAVPGCAHAGAWIAPADGQEIWTNVAGVRGDLQYTETSAYWEIPVASHDAVVIAPWVQQSVDASDEGWKSETTVGLKHALFRNDSGAIALQAGAVWNSEPQAHCSEGAAELRWLGGVNFGRSGFLNVEAAAREGGNTCGEGRFDVTAGYHPASNWLGMAQIYYDAPAHGDASLKLELTLVRFNRKDSTKGIQIGLRARVDGGDPEPALVLGFWGKPGHSRDR